MFKNWFKKKDSTSNKENSASSAVSKACDKDSVFEVLPLVENNSEKFDEAVAYLKRVNNMNLLFKLLMYGDKKCNDILLRELMAFNGNPKELDRFGNDGLNPLLLYSQIEGAAILIRVLANSMANLDVKDSNGRTAILLASENGHADTVQMLLNNGAKDISHPESSGWTPLHYACQRGQYEIVEMLVKSGANVNAISKDNLMPIHVACSTLKMSGMGLRPNGISLNPEQIKNCIMLLIQSGSDLDYKCGLGFSMNELFNNSK